MGFVDLQRRREDHARRKTEARRRNVARDPLLLLGTGFVLGSSVSQLYFGVFHANGLPALLTFLAALALLFYLARLLSGERPERTGPKLGSEKQLLLAMREANRGITPVEAALETSLTVDEAEEILTHLADRGHLMVESQDGALLYALPGRRPV